VQLQRGGSRHLVEVQGCAVGQHGDVDRLTGDDRQPSTDRAALLDQVEARRRCPGQPQNADTEAVLAPLGVLLDQVAGLQGGDQPECRRLVHADLDGDVGDPHLALAGQDLQHRHGPVDRLDRGGLRAAGSGPLVGRAVAHGGTLVLMTQS
jgi:hypothetical protein